MTNEAEHLRALWDASLAISQSVDITDVLRSIVDVVRRLLSAERGTLYVVDWDEGTLWTTVLDEPSLREIRIPIGVGIAGHVARDGETVVINDPYGDSRFNPDVDKKTGFRTRNMLCIPLKTPRSQDVVGVLQILNKAQGEFVQEDVHKIELLANHMATTLQKSLEIHRLHRRKAELQSEVEKQARALLEAHEEITRANRIMSAELETARILQNTLLPHDLPRNGAIRFDAFYRPSSQLSGDLYDVVSLGEDLLGVVIVDVMGHGVPSAMVGAMFKMAFRIHVRQDSSPAYLMRTMNKWLMDTAPSENRMMTAAYLSLDCRGLRMRCSVAGHPHPRLLPKGEGCARLISTGDIPLGLVPDFDFHEQEIQLCSGDRLLLFTDGLHETYNPRGEPLGLETVDRILCQTAGQPSGELIYLLWKASCAHRGHASPEDDISMLVLDMGQPGEATSVQ
ncbi:MAG: GAF domain-containing SpoIIE family protein phosphatase [Thermodesulfobacteriota bacterium]